MIAPPPQFSEYPKPQVQPSAKQIYSLYYHQSADFLLHHAKELQWLFRHLHPDIGIRLALRWSHNHRLKKLKNEVEKGYYDDVPNTRLYQYAAEQAALDPSIDFFVFGHQHKPMQYHSGEHALTTVVGNWIYDFTYAVFDGEKMELRKYTL